MTIKHKLFAPYTVLKAVDVNDYLMNQATVNVGTASELTGIATEVKIAYVTDEGRVYVRGSGNVWAPILRGKAGSISATTNASGDMTVTHGLGIVPAAVSIQGRVAGAFDAHVFAVTALTATTFTA